MKTPYDPKLREAAEEFKALCGKYDCMGVMLLVSKTHAEFVNEVSPSWSVLRMEAPEAFRFRSKGEDFPSLEAQNEATEATAQGVTSIVEWSRQTHAGWSGILDQLRKHMRIMHAAWGDPDSVPGDGR